MIMSSPSSLPSRPAISAAQHLAAVSKTWQISTKTSRRNNKPTRKSQQQQHQQLRTSPSPQQQTHTPWSPNLPAQARKQLAATDALRTAHAHDYDLANQRATAAVSVARARRRVLENLLNVLDERNVEDAERHAAMTAAKETSRPSRHLPDPIPAFLVHLQREQHTNERFLKHRHQELHQQQPKPHPVLTQHQRETCVLFAEKLKLRIFDLVELYNDYRSKIDNVLAEMDSIKP
ncbi:hypothetical protein HDU87_007606 [Geranomyces variabilis]|uniref:Uncharacterized protein n=1 Tax=Geranomyces variabilis TaxID=109894 RepID=A0AAD5TDZ8_9FUNG|nr:hypothetical protein HDU87_007606 [Geranomyces variabilis]